MTISQKSLPALTASRANVMAVVAELRVLGRLVRITPPEFHPPGVSGAHLLQHVHALVSMAGTSACAHALVAEWCVVIKHRVRERPRPNAHSAPRPFPVEAVGELMKCFQLRPSGGCNRGKNAAH